MKTSHTTIGLERRSSHSDIRVLQCIQINTLYKPAIIRALEATGTISIEESSPRTATVYTDSRLTIDSLRNPDNHAYLIEEIRRRVAKLQGSNLQPNPAHQSVGMSLS